MKLTRMGVWCVLGMATSAATVYATTPPGGFGDGSSKPGGDPSTLAAAAPAASGSEEDGAQTNHATFVLDDTVRVEARLGNAAMAEGAATESFVMLELKGSEAEGLATTTPVHLGLVIDRSGSMQGKRLSNAKAAAESAVDRLVDGDTVSVVAFDTSTTTVVPPTRLDASTRPTVRQHIEALTLGGDTCISCGIDASEAFMAQTPDHVRRMIVLSDGDTNAGVRDLPGMRALAQSVHIRGTTLSSIGVDLAYNERIMAAIAEGGEGLHHFVADPSDLSRVFESEALSARSTVAQNLEAHVRLEPGVELVEVLDRSFTRSGTDLVFPLGSLSKGEVKTVLARVRVSASHAAEAPVAAVEIRYRDLAKAKDVHSTGNLAATVATTTSEVDPFVGARVERSQTASALQQANDLFRQGKLEEARKTLGARHATLEKARKKLDFDKMPFSPSRGKDAQSDVDRQLDSLSRAENGFATPPPASPPRPGSPRPVIASPANPFESNAKQNQADATFEMR